ncbi:zf-HC2 domain-containing protein [Aldersonia sp. NBC_00410]|uniref:anti-sigma factor family protein n=1 Tax=Aldersonia sp. NBC_00410 TaxID=2975954 RepID=UPI002253B399|nr:zf-HC2 domain-containing protein [Aldersonia sp. NBC_00410]MCX5044984.1 zf-HC2 domain-containing protein [Aldersonia sp. NBC_00410]
MRRGADGFGIDADTSSTGSDEFATWDAAYVLGALTPADRRRYEGHLDDCPACRAAVGELAGLPGMLALVPRQTALEMLDDASSGPAVGTTPTVATARSTPPPPDALMHDLVGRTRRERRRRRMIAIGTAVAAAAAAVAIAVPLVVAGNSEDSPTGTATQPEVVASRTMDPLVSTPLSANVDLIDDGAGGSQVNMECRYAPGGTSYTGEYSMWITTNSGVQSHLATWTAQPGDVIEASAAVDVPPADIQQVDIRATTTNQVLLSTVL